MHILVGRRDIGQRINNAWLATIEDGIGTYDIAPRTGRSSARTRSPTR